VKGDHESLLEEKLYQASKEAARYFEEYKRHHYDELLLK
jgi:hypothetical protein